MSIANNAPENTSRRLAEAHLLGMMGSPDSYITDMESAGQRQLLASTTLPAEGPWEDLIALGFTKGDKVDELFVKATLPEGWAKQGSDHAMYSYVCDERGVKRVNIFYKAAFYDRRADMHLVSPGSMAATEALYGDGPAALPEHWGVFTLGERAAFVLGLDRMDANIAEHPAIYGEHVERLAAIRALLAEVSA